MKYLYMLWFKAYESFISLFIFMEWCQELKEKSSTSGFYYYLLVSLLKDTAVTQMTKGSNIFHLVILCARLQSRSPR